jgi:hypothetical protein
MWELLSGIPGKKSYTAIKQLTLEHPNPKYRSWMAKQAYKRAEEDGDLEPWLDEQVSTFDKSQTITPPFRHQLQVSLVVLIIKKVCCRQRRPDPTARSGQSDFVLPQE